MERTGYASVQSGINPHFQHPQIIARPRSPHVVPQLARQAARTATRRLVSARSTGPVADSDALRCLHGRQSFRGCLALASLKHCPLCGSYSAPKQQGHQWPSSHNLAPANNGGRRRTACTAARRGMLSSEYTPQMSSSPGTQPFFA